MAVYGLVSRDSHPPVDRFAIKAHATRLAMTYGTPMREHDSVDTTRTALGSAIMAAHSLADPYTIATISREQFIRQALADTRMFAELTHTPIAPC